MEPRGALPIGSSEAVAAAAWRGRHMAGRRNVYRRPGACPGTPGLQARARHSTRPATAPSQAARPGKRPEGSGQALATDWPNTARALTSHGERLVLEAAARAPPPRDAGAGAAKLPELAPGEPPPTFAAPRTHWAEHRPYRWVPTQARQHDFAEACAEAGTHFSGTYVNTLSAPLGLPEADWTAIPVPAPHQASVHLKAQRPLQCCLVQESLVLCRGLLMAAHAQQGARQREGELPLCRLPEGLRPHAPLRFAALTLDKDDCTGLVALCLTPDGWVTCAGGLGPRSVVDLGAIRFCLARGLSLLDGVRLHTCDVPGGRLVVLQGSLAPRAFAPGGPCPLASLPSSCRPAGALPFAAAGARAGSFHLLLVRPGGAAGAAGDVAWGDGKWQGVDEVSLSGVAYEVAPEALRFCLGAQPWTSNRRAIAIGDFQRCLVCRYGSLADAWRRAYGGRPGGVVNFSAFGAGCRAAGYRGDVSRLWAMLDVDRSGEICLDEMSVDVDSLEVKCLARA